jgi:uncharacterized membrane protein YkoI
MCRSASRRDNALVFNLSALTMFRTICTICTALALLTSPITGITGGERDQDRARQALKAGEVMPLVTILERVARQHPGQVLEVELERDDGTWIYELRVLEPGGGLVKLKVNARTGEILKSGKDRS